jgi:catechol 2,3-dioxygenase-like lactoylglutathione lyase family enzyme
VRSRGYRVHLPIFVTGLWLVIGAGAPAGSTVAPAVDLSLFKHVTRIGWVVKDVDSVTAYWEKLGLRNIRRTTEQTVAGMTWRGQGTPARVRTAQAAIGGVTVEWIQPVSGSNAWSEFLQRHGDGIHHLAFTMPDETRWRGQLDAFGSRGVDVVQQGTLPGAADDGAYAYLDTAGRGGGLTIALQHGPAAPAAPSPAAHDYPFTRITQYAFVVRDVAKVSDFYQRIGLGALPFDRMISIDRMYRGRPVPFEMYLGWGRTGDVPFEWIQSLVGPSVYDEYLQAHGEGFHHVAFNVRDMDEAIALMETRGAKVTQSGGWDFPDSKGRFAYLDTERVGGVSTELLWNRP